MEHPGEVWQELDYNGERLGGIEPSKCDFDKIKRFLCVVVVLYRFKDGEVEYLFQHRSKNLKGNPDKWDVSAGGHVNVGESLIEAMVREAYEEIGAEIDEDKLEFVALYLRWKVMCGLYFYDWTGKKDNFHFDDHEVEEVKWVKYSGIDEFSVNFKRVLAEDEVFKYYLEEWNKKILERYENI